MEHMRDGLGLDRIASGGPPGGGRRWIDRIQISRMTLLLAGFGLALLAVDAMRIASEREATLAEARRNAATLVGSIALHAEGMLSTTETLLSGLVAHLEGEGRDSGRLPPFFDALVEGRAPLDWIARVAFYDGTGAQRLGPRRSVGWNSAERPYFALHRDDPDRTTRVSVPVPGRATGRWVLPLTRRVDNPDGSFAGVALVALDMERLFATYHALGLPAGAVLASFAADGRLLMRHPLLPGNLGRPVEASPIAAAIAEKIPSGNLEYVSPLDGRSMLSSFRRFDGGRMVMVLGLDRDAVLAGWRHAAAWHVAGVALLAGVIAALGFLLDRADRRRVAADLARARRAAKRQVLAQHASDIVLEHDLAFRCRYASAHVLEQFGRDALEVMGTARLDALDPADPDEVARLFARAARGEADVRGVTLLRRPHGRETWVQIVLRRFDQPGEPGLILGVVSDVTARRAAEQQAAAALGALRTEYANLLRAERIAQVGHWRLHAGGAHLALSAEACRIHNLPLPGLDIPDRGAAPADPRGDRSRTSLDALMACIAEDDRETVRTAVREALADWRAGNDRFLRVDYRVLGPPDQGVGGERHVACFGEPERDAAGCVVGVIGTAQDVTARVVMERELRHEQKMHMIGQLAAGVAHDFNNLLQSVVGCLELIGDAIPPASPANRYLAIALASAERGSSLTRQLLSCARRQTLAPGRIEAAALLPEMALLLQRTLGPHIAVRAEVGPDVAAFRADPAHLNAALLNLGVNAGHAMPGGGRLTLSAASGPDRIVIAVADTGSGMSAATLALACEPFFTTKGTGGTGLGLAMVNGFAQQSGGEMRLFSEPGRGTRVELHLPALPPLAEASAPASPPVPAGPPAPARPAPREAVRALVVDDASDVLVTVAAFLGAAAIEVELAGDGESALARLDVAGRSAAAIDVLVTDYAMPGLDGAETIRRARKRRPDLAAVMITGFADIDVSGLPQGVRLLHKPFQRSDLLDAVRAVVGPRIDDMMDAA